MNLRRLDSNEEISVRIEPRDGGARIEIAERRIEILPLTAPGPAGAAYVDGRPVRYLFHRQGSRLRIALKGELHEFEVDDRPTGGRSSSRTSTSPETRSPMPGKVLQVSVAPGDRVAAGDPLLILEAMKMENVLFAEIDGVVEAVHVAAGEMVEPGKVLVVIRPNGEP
jgi:acetyl-CoA/propionyl-CoA carboxylase biotin carboxyl carrier protein